MSDLFKRCPECNSVRNAKEFTCQNTTELGALCDFDLTNQPLYSDFKKKSVPYRTIICKICGHHNDSDELICRSCNETIISSDAKEIRIKGHRWTLLRNLPGISGSERRFEAEPNKSGLTNNITIFKSNYEPSAEVYSLLGKVNSDQFATIAENGRIENKA